MPSVFKGLVTVQQTCGGVGVEGRGGALLSRGQGSACLYSVLAVCVYVGVHIIMKKTLG